MADDVPPVVGFPAAEPNPVAMDPVVNPANPPNPVNQNIIDDLDLPIVDTPSARVDNPLVVISRKNRPTDLDKKTSLFEAITKKQHDRYKLMSTSLKSISDLSETYGLQILLKSTKSIFAKYDLLDVFMIVFPIEDDGNGPVPRALERRNGEIRKVPLMSDYLGVTPEEVARSTLWYVTWTDHARAPWISENLSLSYEFFRNHVEDTLWGKLLEDMVPYADSPAQGGPLIFVFMMRRLQANSQLVITTIQTKIKSLRIDQYEGENVSDLVSHLRALIDRLRTLERKDENGRVITPVMPTDLNKTLLKMLQTSSDTDFNTVFRNKEMNGYERALTEGDSAYGNPETTLNLANAIYADMVASEKGWTGADRKVSDAVFVAGSGTKCFNCGGHHLLSKCPKPIDEARVAKNKKEFWNKKKSGKKSETTKESESGEGKGWPPAPTGDRKKNRRKINGKYYFYHFNEKKWKLCDNQSENANKPFLVNLAESPTTSKNETSKAEDSSTKAKEAASNFIAAIQKNVNALASDLSK